MDDVAAAVTAFLILLAIGVIAHHVSIRHENAARRKRRLKTRKEHYRNLWEVLNGS